MHKTFIKKFGGVSSIMYCIGAVQSSSAWYGRV